MQQYDVWMILINNVLTQTDNEEVKSVANELLESSKKIKNDVSQLIEKIEQKKGD